jgi:energy-coupling factor transport system ATP-binding protein
VLLTEHRLEDAFPLSDRVLVMDSGRLMADGTPSEVGELLRGSGHGMFLAMPTAMRVWASVEEAGPSPITVRDGRSWLADYAARRPLEPLPDDRPPAHGQEDAVTLEDVWFKYEKDLPDVVKGVSMTVKKGEFLALLGGNGTGKTTTLSLIGGLRLPYRGEVKLNGRVGTLPQDPQTLFVKKTVREDLFELFRGMKTEKSLQEARVARAVQLCRLEELLDRHPYDLSGGEQQRAALAKVLLLDPEILLLDEPTKGLDAEFKQVFAVILKTLQRRGVTVFMVSHDVEFCAAYADRCALFFDGNIVSEGRPRQFFSGNSFYTTSANRIARDLLPEAVTPLDLMQACGGSLPPQPELPEDAPPLPEPAEDSAAAKPPKLPLWRLLLGILSGLGALGLAVYTLSHQDLSSLIREEGLTSAAIADLPLYLILVACLLICVFALSRRAPDPARVQTPREKRKLSKRTALAAACILLLIPLTIFIGVYYLSGRKYYFIAMLILLETMLPFFLVFEGRKPQARELVVIAVLCAIGVVGRAAFFMLPAFKPVLALVIIAGVGFGGETGFLVGAMTMVASNVLFGQGPWTPWQMFSAGIIGFLAGVLFRKGLLRRSRVSLCIFGAVATVVIYGGIMNPAAALIYTSTLEWKTLLTYYVSGIPVDLVHAAATVLFLWLASQPMLEKLDRIKVKYGLME